MTVLIDISHPAHVHFYRHLAEALIAKQVKVHIVARDKDVTVQLLEASALPFEVMRMGRPGAGRFAAAGELLRRSLHLRRSIRRDDVKVLLTRNPSGAIAAFGTRATSIFDTVDGRHVGAHYWAARPFADIITSSVLDPESHGRGHRRYPGLREQMALHPDRFTPDLAVRRQYLSDDEEFGVVRFSAHDASHDRKTIGITPAGRQAILQRLDALGPVLVSIEREGLYLRRGPRERITVSPRDFHHLLAAAAIFVGDSQSVAAEAAVLGVPALRLSSFSGQLFYLKYLESVGLMRNFMPGEEAALLEALNRTLSHHRESKSRYMSRAEAIRNCSGDIATWYLQLILTAATPDSVHTVSPPRDGR